MTRLGVLGWPVAHSRSPAMQNAALAALGLDDWVYQLLPVAPDLLAETVPALADAGFRGVNVTIPHKEAALALATEATDRALRIGAANTLTFGDAGAIHADNTDAPGLIAALAEPPAAGATALVLGAGGSGRAACWALRAAGARVRIWNRTHGRAEELAKELGIEVAPHAGPGPADLLVNCTSAGLGDPSTTFTQLPLDPEELSTYATVVDLVYRPGGTALLNAAARAGCATVDGLEVLVQQGALSLEAWTGLPAPVDVMRAAVHSDLPDDDTRTPSPPPGHRDPSDRGGARP